MAMVDLKTLAPEAQAIIAKLQAENAALKAQKQPGRLTLKVGEKGGLCIFGLQRFPVTLYASQWLRILDMAEDIRKFIEENKATLANKS